MEATELINGANIVLVTLVLAITSGLKIAFDSFFSSKLGQRLLPIVPIILGVIGGLVGIADPAETIVDKITVGFLSGLSAAVAYKLGKTTILGQGVKEKEVKKKE